MPKRNAICQTSPIRDEIMARRLYRYASEQLMTLYPKPMH